jgi:signal transduction histidine kinase
LITRKSSTRKIALAGFVALSMIVLISLISLTRLTMELEQQRLETEAQHEFQQRVDTVLAALDGIVSDILNTETAREYWVYSFLYKPTRAYWSWRDEFRPEDVQPIRAENVYLTSELAEIKLEPWFLLHVQHHPLLDEWTSPQVVPDDLEHRFGVSSIDPDRAKLQSRTIERLNEQFPPQSAAYRFAEADESWSTQLERNGVEFSDDVHKGTFLRRAAEAGRAASRQLMDPICEPADSAMFNLTGVLDEQSIQQLPNVASSGEVAIEATKFRPIWVGEEEAEKLLVFLRIVYRGDDESFNQAFVLDWPLLKAALLDAYGVRDIFANADIVPIEERTNYAYELSQIRARIEPHEEPVVATGWTSTRTSLVLIWIAAGIVLSAIGLGIRALLAISERRMQFAYAVTHELRTPLTTMCLYTDMLANDMVPAAARDQYLATLNTESERLSQLVSNVLEYARIENRSARLDIADTTAAEVIEEVERHFADRCKKAGLHLQSDLNGQAKTKLKSDRDAIVRIIGTLIDNACRYARNPDDPTIELAVNADAHHIHFDVSDRGPGISPEDRPHIFRPFRRGKSTNQSPTSGLGLGLSLARNWATLLGGKLSLMEQSPEMIGAAFRLSLPSQL